MNEKLYKYRSFNDEFLNNIILNQSLYYAPIKTLNDPFDCRLDFKKEYTEEERKNFVKKDSLQKLSSIGKNTNDQLVQICKNANEKLLDKIGVLSLSTDCKNILMWSHYANNHYGLVFEFERLNLEGYDCLTKAIEVDYSKEYELLSYEKDKDLMTLILTKYKDWTYESEYRCIDIHFQGEKKFHKNELKSILFGMNVDDQQIEEFKKLCFDNGFEHVKFKKAKKVKGKFELDFDDI